jgi:hypothetical protein
MELGNAVQRLSTLVKTFSLIATVGHKVWGLGAPAAR